MFRALFAVALVSATNALSYVPAATGAEAVKAINEATLKKLGWTQEEWDKVQATLKATPTDADALDKQAKYTTEYANQSGEWVKANTKTPTADEIKSINEAAMASLDEATRKQVEDYNALDATAKADAANAALATAYGKFTAAQTAELAKWAADSSAFATVAAGAIIAAAALF